MSSKELARMMGQYNKATKTPDEFIKYALAEGDNLFEWYIMLSNFSGDNDEFEGGEYLCKMVAPPNFPYLPPKFYLLTENGVYGTGGVICISIGEFHAEQYRATLGMSGFAQQLLSGMVGWRELGEGIRILHTSVEAKAELAKKSREDNRKKHPEIVARIESAYAAYSSGWKKTENASPGTSSTTITTTSE